jgi:hypothetical protein
MMKNMPSEAQEGRKFRTESKEVVELETLFALYHSEHKGVKTERRHNRLNQPSFVDIS